MIAAEVTVCKLLGCAGREGRLSGELAAVAEMLITNKY